MAEATSTTPAATVLAQAGPATRFVLHAGDAQRQALAEAFGAALPEAINLAAGRAEARAALKLGPDEWLLIVGDDAAQAIAAALSAAAGDAPISLVEVSDRQVGLTIAGPQAALALNAGVPLDLSLEAFPVGMATRTIFEKTEIVLWRTQADAFRLEVWRSFAPYLCDLLAIAIAENAAAP